MGQNPATLVNAQETFSSKTRVGWWNPSPRTYLFGFDPQPCAYLERHRFRVIQRAAIFPWPKISGASNAKISILDIKHWMFTCAMYIQHVHMMFSFVESYIQMSVYSISYGITYTYAVYSPLAWNSGPQHPLPIFPAASVSRRSSKSSQLVSGEGRSRLGGSPGSESLSGAWLMKEGVEAQILPRKDFTIRSKGLFQASSKN